MRRSLFISILLTISFSFSLYPQVFHKEDHPPRRLQGSLHNTRGYSRFTKKSNVQEEGLAQFRQIAIVDGNLVTGPVTNSGVISYGGIGNDIRIGWPKGPKFSQYIWGSFFYVGAEVIGANGDTLHIISDNIPGENSTDQTHELATMPLPGYYNLDRPGSLNEPLIGGISEDVGKDGFPNTGDEGEGDGKLQPEEDFNGNGQLDLSMKNEVNWFAISSRKETWPEYWPVGTYPGDDRQPGENRPGVRAGRWNGEFGAFIRADQEIYYAMDDRENDEFEYYPFPGDTAGWPNGRRGLGIKIENRDYQWNARLAEDILICIYDISLYEGAQDLPKAVVGMYCDPDLGGSFTNDDAFFDEIDDITYSWNKLFISNEGLPLGYFGFAFLESPGLSFDGIDNDQDGLTDESQSNGIDDDGDWVPWEDTNMNGVWDNEDVNFNGTLDPGEDVNENGILDIEPLNDDLGSDGLGPQFLEYHGPDPDGTEANGQPDPGEPNFDQTDNDESDQVGLTSFFLRSTQANFGYGGRNDEHFWSVETLPGTFEIVPGYTTDISFTYGSGYIQFNDNERTHRYAIALLFGNDFDDILRNKRTMQEIYDKDYNFAKPPLQPLLTAYADDHRVFLSWDSRAERSRDPIYGKDFEAYYVYRSTDPTFNEIKTITDAFGNPLLFKPMAIFDKIDGLKGPHPVRIGSEIGGSSDLGITYNMGTDSGLEHNFVDTDVTNGRTYFYAVASIDQGYHPDFYPDISPKQNLLPISPTESPVNIQIDPLGRPISFDPNTAQVIPTEHSAGWQSPQLDDDGIEHVSGRGTGTISVAVYNPLLIKNGYRYRVEFDDDGSLEQFDTLNFTGKLNQMTIYSVTENSTVTVINDPHNNELTERYLADGFRVTMYTDTTGYDSARTGWTSGNSQLRPINLTNPAQDVMVPRDYEFRIMGIGADTSFNHRPANFQIWDVTDPDNQYKMSFLYIDNAPEFGVLDEGDIITIFNNPHDRKTLYRFKFDYPATVDTADWIAPREGDVLKIVTKKSFDRYDAFEFTMVGNSYSNEKAKNDLDNIYTVPDPYIAVSTLERKVFNPDEGRGDRRIDFVNLPRQCTVKIFTASGRLVRTLQHSATEKNRRLSWDLRTKDGLEIAHGVYFYVVDAPGIGTKTGKFAVIK